MEQQIFDIIKDWIWVPFVTLVTTAAGWHIKEDREARSQHREDIEDLHKRIERERDRNDHTFVGKDEFAQFMRRMESIADDVKYIRRNGINGGNK